MRFNTRLSFSSTHGSCTLTGEQTRVFVQYSENDITTFQCFDISNVKNIRTDGNESHDKKRIGSITIDGVQVWGSYSAEDVSKFMRALLTNS
jgi:hypothetical protein